MGNTTGWEFTDDRGHLVTALRRPARVVAYIQAAAALWDHGLRPVGAFGSAHDRADSLDRAKAGELPLDDPDFAYFGAGGALDVDALLASGADLVVCVTYGGGQLYGIGPEAAKRLEEQVPLAALDIGQGRSLDQVRERCTELARALGAAPDPAADAELRDAEAQVRAAASSPTSPRVLALSGADQDTVHLARPHAWPDLAALASLGVRLCEPPAEGGVNWATTPWSEATALAPDVVLSDARGNAAPGHNPLAATVTTVPWNPELPPSARAHARYLRAVAAALDTTGRTGTV
ncbi:ABC transporter substrate-binding protein [Streptomyces monticola]|uniref:ABC transporter substrate-binding protein n=1 Tax=Streptomyces monticola TaxID=2666263 RepID=A0ABW2JE99_9ACTN